MPPKKVFTYGNKPASSLKKSDDVTKKEEGPENEEMKEFNERNYLKNTSELKRIRTYSAVNAGVAAGIFGFSGLNGLLFYLFMYAVVSLALYYKSKLNPTNYFLTNYEVLVGSWSADLLLYIMLWVIAHNLVNII